MNKHLLFYVFLLLSTSVVGQATFNIPFDTLIQMCPPDSVNLYLFADSGNSNAYTYDTIPYQTEPVGGTSINMSDDQVAGPYNIGFTFSFYCGQYTQFYICSNGWIGFSNGQTATWVVQSIPSTNNNTPKNCIMGPWRDWNPASGQGPYITYQTVGTAPLRKLIVTWSSVPMYSCTSSYGTFQIVLHEASNIIHNNLTNVPVCTGWGNGDGTEGVHNSTGTIATAVNGRNDSQFTISNQSIRFIPTSPIVWNTLGGQPFAIGNGINVSFPSSTWVQAQGVTCNGDTLHDSVFVAVSCIKLITDSLDVDCTNDSTGYAVAIDTSTVTAGPYQFIWVHDETNDTLAVHSSPNDTDTLFNAPAGNYTVYAFGSNGEFAMGWTTIHEPDTLNNAPTAEIPVLCNGDATGKAVAWDLNNYNGLDWDGTYDFYWSPDSTVTDSTIGTTQNSDTLTGLTAGTYFVTVDGCFITKGSVTVTEPDEVTAAISNETMTQCPGVNDCDASAIANAGGGVSPYTYLWSSGEQSAFAQALCADSNFVTITDANGCDTSAWVWIIKPDSIITQAFGRTQICITNIAGISASTVGGTAPYEYVWTSGSLNGPVVGTSAMANVEPHVTTRYFVSTTDTNGCSGDTASVLIKVRPPLGLELPLIDTICPYDTIDIPATGVGGDSIYTYAWSSGSIGPIATVSPDEPKWFQVTVSDYCGTPSYVDSVFVQVGGYSPINALIEAEDDSLCIGEDVYLIASGKGGFKGPDEYRFEWNQPSWDGNPIRFVRPNKTTEYIITITDLCLSPAGSDTLTIHVGEPEVPILDIHPAIACGEANVRFIHENYNPKSHYDWSLGDGDAVFNAQSDTIMHRYDAVGCYNLGMEIMTEFGCESSYFDSCAVQVLTVPTAGLSLEPIETSTMEPFATFYDESQNAAMIEWYLNEVPQGSDSSIYHEFIDTGWYEVAMVATSTDGCQDTLIRKIYHRLAQTLYIPQAFTPNSDDANDVFKIYGEGLVPEDFEMVIFDRWGREVFRSENPDFEWDGKRIDDGERLPIGNYPYTLRYRDGSGEIQVATGSIIIHRNGERTGL